MRLAPVWDDQPDRIASGSDGNGGMCWERACTRAHVSQNRLNKTMELCLNVNFRFQSFDIHFNSSNLPPNIQIYCLIIPISCDSNFSPRKLPSASSSTLSSSAIAKFFVFKWRGISFAVFFSLLFKILFFSTELCCIRIYTIPFLDSTTDLMNSVHVVSIVNSAINCWNSANVFIAFATELTLIRNSISKCKPL